jgi:outer membrane biosynthesis protein TonB
LSTRAAAVETSSSISLNRAVVISALLHLAVFLIAWFGVPQLFHDATPETPLVVEVLPLGEVTNAPSRPEPPQAQAPQPTPPKPAPPQPEPPKPQPPKPPPPAPPPPPTPPPPAPPQPTPPPPKPVPPPPPVPAPKAEAVPPPPPPPRPAPPKPQKPATPQFNLDNLLKDLTRRQPTPSTPAAPAAPTQSASRNMNTNFNPEMPLSVSEQDAIRQKIMSNWNVDIGAKGIETFVVQLRIWVLPDGTVQSARIESTDHMDDPAYRSFAESAVRAALESSPLPLPADKAGEITDGKLILVFSAKDMLGAHG